MRILLSLLLLATFAPLPAQAYLTPEEVLQQEDLVAPPPNARNAAAARAAQEAEYDARVAAETAAAEDAAAQNPDSNTLDDLHGSADGEEVIDWTDPEAALSAQERHDQRVLDRVERDRLDDMATGVVLHGAAPDEPLHGGAPLAPSGPGTIAAVLAIAAAVGFTLRKALRA